MFSGENHDRGSSFAETKLDLICLAHLSFFLAAIPSGKTMKNVSNIHNDNCILICLVFSAGNLLKKATDEFGA